MNKDYLYSLLPSIYRERDGVDEAQLRHFMAALQIQAERLEADIDSLYDDWFIETCSPWAVPLIAELVGADRLFPLSEAFNKRGLVADAVRLRAARGTAATLADALTHMAGWGVAIANLEDQIAATQSMRLPQTKLRRAADLRTRDRSYKVELRSLHPRMAGSRPGLYGLHRAAALVHRALAYPMEGSTPVEAQEGCFRFDSFGRDIALYCAPAGATEGARALTRKGLQQLLDAGQDLPVSITGSASLPIVAGNLDDWKTVRQDAITVDPERGRFTMPTASAAAPKVSYWYAATDDLGAGPYARALPASESMPVVRDSATCDTTPFNATQTGVLLYRAASGQVPTLKGDLVFNGRPAQDGDTSGMLMVTLEGFRILGTIKLSGNVELQLNHCTLIAPDRQNAVEGVAGSQSSLSVILHGCIVQGTIALSCMNAALSATRCLIDGCNSAAVQGHAGSSSDDDPGPSLRARETTFFGDVVVSLAEECIDTLIAGKLILLDPRQLPAGHWLDSTGARQIAQFYSRNSADVLYGRLRSESGASILHGAQDGRELGVFHQTSWPSRRSALQKVAEQWVPLGVDITLLGML